MYSFTFLSNVDEIASIVCKSPEISISNQFYSLLFCLLYLCLFALFFLLTHRDSAVNFPIHLCLGLLLMLFFNSFLTHLTTLRLLLSTFFSLFSLPLYLTFTDIFPLSFLHLLTSLLHHLSLLYYSYQVFLPFFLFSRLSISFINLFIVFLLFLLLLHYH